MFSMQTILIGFQGAGKTTLGRALGKRYSIPFVDLDEEIVRVTCTRSVRDAFLELGERRFREIEEEVALSLLATETGLIAFGGGAIAPLARIPKGVVVLYLFQTFERLCRIVTAEPLWIDRARPKGSLKERWQERHPIFTAHATEIVSLGYSSVEEDVLLVGGRMYGK